MIIAKLLCVIPILKLQLLIGWHMFMQSLNLICYQLMWWGRFSVLLRVLLFQSFLTLHYFLILLLILLFLLLTFLERRTNILVGLKLKLRFSFLDRLNLKRWLLVLGSWLLFHLRLLLLLLLVLHGIVLIGRLIKRKLRLGRFMLRHLLFRLV